MMGDISRECTEGKCLNSMMLRQYELCCVNQNVQFAKVKSAEAVDKRLNTQSGFTSTRQEMKVADDSTIEYHGRFRKSGKRSYLRNAF
jgi:hypothetical protein